MSTIGCGAKNIRRDGQRLATTGSIFPKHGVQHPSVMALQILTFPHSIVRLSTIVPLRRSSLSENTSPCLTASGPAHWKQYRLVLSQEFLSRANPASVCIYHLYWQYCCAKYQSFFTTFLFAFYSRSRSYRSLLMAPSSSYSSGILSIQRTWVWRLMRNHACPPPNRPLIFLFGPYLIFWRGQPESPLLDRCCYPIQSASPDPSRYKIWSKARRPTIVGFPHWTREELVQG